MNMLSGDVLYPICSLVAYLVVYWVSWGIGGKRGVCPPGVSLLLSPWVSSWTLFQPHTPINRPINNSLLTRARARAGEGREVGSRCTYILWGVLCTTIYLICIEMVQNRVFRHLSPETPQIRGLEHHRNVYKKGPF